jgi:hypothetical protein
MDEREGKAIPAGTGEVEGRMESLAKELTAIVSAAAAFALVVAAVVDAALYGCREASTDRRAGRLVDASDDDAKEDNEEVEKDEAGRGFRRSSTLRTLRIPPAAPEVVILPPSMCIIVDAAPCSSCCAGIGAGWNVNVWKPGAAAEDDEEEDEEVRGGLTRVGATSVAGLCRRALPALRPAIHGFPGCVCCLVAVLAGDAPPCTPDSSILTSCAAAGSSTSISIPGAACAFVNSPDDDADETPASSSRSLGSTLRRALTNHQLTCPTLCPDRRASSFFSCCVGYGCST